MTHPPAPLALAQALTMSDSDSSRGPANSIVRPAASAIAAAASRAPTSRTATGCVRPRGAKCTGPRLPNRHTWAANSWNCVDWTIVNGMPLASAARSCATLAA